MTRYCAHCGAKVEDNEKFCSECGSMIGKKEDTPKKKVIVEDADETTDEVKNKPNNDENTKNSSSNILICIVGIVVVFIVLWGIIGFFTGGNGYVSEVTVDGVKFHIPEGFIEDKSLSNKKTDELKKSSGVSTAEAKCFKNGDEFIYLYVHNTDKKRLSVAVDKNVEKRTTINGKTGILTFNTFGYIDHGKLIGVATNNHDLYYDIIE